MTYVAANKYQLDNMKGRHYLVFTYGLIAIKGSDDIVVADVN